MSPTSDITLWHNPRCSKSREALELLDDAGATYALREYLKEPPTRAELDELVDALGLDDPRAMMRAGEDAYGQLGLADADPEELLVAIVDNPILLERPIAVRGDRAVIGRPPTRVLSV